MNDPELRIFMQIEKPSSNSIDDFVLSFPSKTRSFALICLIQVKDQEGRYFTQNNMAWLL